MKTIAQLRQDVRQARAEHDRAQIDLELSQGVVDRASEAVAEWRRDHDGTPRFIDPVRDDGLAADGKPPDIAKMDPTRDQELIPDLEARLAEKEQALEEAETALADAVESGQADQVDTSTGWVCVRDFKWQGDQYRQGDAFDPTDLSVRQWEKLRDARHIRPVKVPA